MLLSPSSEFLFADSACAPRGPARVWKWRNAAAAGAAVAAARLRELLSLHSTMQLSPEAREANWNRCGINPSLRELC